MVKMKASDDFEQLDTLVRSLCEKHNFKLYVDGWTRKSYRIFSVDPASRHQDLVASLEKEPPPQLDDPVQNNADPGKPGPNWKGGLK